jgi:glycosyltransferase involved in cell wall biosynthesis
MPTVFFAFRDAPDRRAALRDPHSLDRYRLFGLDEIRARGADVRHNLERDGAPPAWARAAASVVNRALYASGGYGGDFASALASLRVANGAEVVFATADSLAIPLLLLKKVGLLRPPIVYTAIGLPERLVQVRRRRLYAAALRGARTIVAYSQAEQDFLRQWIGSGVEIVFVPFGADVDAFRPLPDARLQDDVVSIGADPHRDFRLLKTVAARHPDLCFRIVATADHIRELGALPDNVRVETGLTLEEVRDRLAMTRVVALPVRRNSYSGATTVVLQAMAMEKPVVVSRTEAIARGYALEDHVNCRLVEPEDADAFERALLETLREPGTLGTRARETVERDFSWERYTGALWDILSSAWARDDS